LAFVVLVVSGVASADTANPDDWIEVSADGKFSVSAPRGTTFARSAGIDSFTGVFNAPGFAVHVDFGAHSDPLEPDRNRAQFFARPIQVDGKSAKLVTARSRTGPRPYFIGMHVPNVRRSAVGAVGLTLTSDLARAQDYALVEAVYRSVRFK
jgi:hypothetical protein